MTHLQYDQQKLKSVCHENGVKYLGVFGSHSRGDFTPTSDLDLLVEFSNTKSLFEKGGFILKLQELFAHKVDLVNKNNIKPSLKPYILKDLVSIYEER